MTMATRRLQTTASALHDNERNVGDGVVMSRRDSDRRERRETAQRRSFIMAPMRRNAEFSLHSRVFATRKNECRRKYRYGGAEGNCPV